MKGLNNQLKVSIFFIVLYVFFELFRSFFQAIYSVYYLDRGLTLGDVSSVKSFQIIALLIFALPAGYLSDKFGRLKILAFSAVTMAISFFLLAKSQSYISFSVAEFIYGMGFAFSSGALLSYINQYQEEENIRIKPSVMGYTISLSSLFTFISGSIGAYLYKYNIEIPFILGCLGMLLYPLFIYFLLKSFNMTDNKIKIISVSNENITTEKIEETKKELNKAEFFLYLLASIIFVGGSQFIYQYWSIFFIVQNHFNANLAYACTTASSIIGGFIFAKILSKKSVFISIIITNITLLLPLFFINERYLISSLIFFTISQIGRGMMFSLFIRLGNDVAFLFRNKSFMFQLVSIFTQLFTICSLLIIPLLLTKVNMVILFHYTALIYVFLLPTLLIIYKKLRIGSSTNKVLM